MTTLAPPSDDAIKTAIAAGVAAFLGGPVHAETRSRFADSVAAALKAAGIEATVVCDETTTPHDRMVLGRMIADVVVNGQHFVADIDAERPAAS
jgi:hypothetical protein